MPAETLLVDSALIRTAAGLLIGCLLLLALFAQHWKLLALGQRCAHLEAELAAHQTRTRGDPDLQTLLDSLPIAAAYRKGDSLLVNRAAEQLTGYTRQALANPIAWFATLHGRDRDRARQYYESDRQTVPTHPRIQSIIHRDGWVLWVEFAIAPCGSDEIWLLQDITNHEQMRQALCESQERYRALADASLDSIFILDQRGILQYANPAAARAFGCEPQTLIGQSFYQVQPPETVFRNLQIVQRLLDHGETATIEEPRRLGETTHWYETHLLPLCDEHGRRNRVMCVGRDITTRRTLEQRLRQYQHIVAALPDAVSLVDSEYRYRVVNDEYLRRTGKRREQIEDQPVAEIMGTTTFAEVVKPQLDRCLGGESIQYQAWFNLSGKDARFLDVSYTPYRDESGAITGILVSSRDITPLKQLQEQAQVALAKYQLLFDTFPLGVTVTDADGRILETNQMAAHLLGLPAETHRQLSITDPAWHIVHLDGTPIPATERVSVRALREQRRIENAEIGVIRPDGQTVWLSVTAAPLPLAGYGVVITYHDISDRLCTEQTLRESEQRFQTLFARHDAIMLLIAPDTGRILNANRAAEHFYGYDLAQLRRMNIADLNTLPPDELRRERERALHETCNSFIFSHRRADGSLRTVEVHSSPIPFGDRKVLFSIIHDITERQQAEQALRQSLREKEILLREIHHRVKNNLAAIIGLVDLQRQAATTPPEHQILLAELANRFKSMALVHDMLYRAEALNRIDFHVYLQALSDCLRAAFTPSEPIQVDTRAPGIWLTLDTAIPCGLIVNELLVNAFKYAFPDGRPRAGASGCLISVTVTQNDGACTLRVADNGIGLPENLDWTTTRTLGLRLVRMLSRQPLQGYLEVDCSTGTCFLLRFNVTADASTAATALPA